MDGFLKIKCSNQGQIYLFQENETSFQTFAMQQVQEYSTVEHSQ